MDTEKLQINLAPDTTKVEVIIRETGEVNELPVKAAEKINIYGTIQTVSEYLKKRKDCTEQVNQKRCHILVDRERISITLITNENDYYAKDCVKASLSLHPKFQEFGINAGKIWTPSELGMFFKMNRAFFSDLAENMRLVTELMNFTATVNNSIERSAKENGDRTEKFAQVVNSNLPKSFTLKIPIFKGMESEILEVETFARIDGREISFLLLSPGANQILEEGRDRVIDTEIKTIRDLCPDIAIIEV